MGILLSLVNKLWALAKNYFKIENINTRGFKIYFPCVFLLKDTFRKLFIIKSLKELSAKIVILLKIGKNLSFQLEFQNEISILLNDSSKLAFLTH